MMDERREEQACLYVLGALAPEENTAFEAELKADPPLRQLVVTLRDVTRVIAGTAPPVKPPAELRHRILGRIGRPHRSVALPKPPEPETIKLSWVPWLIAICLGLACVVLMTERSNLSRQSSDLAQRLTQLDQSAKALRNETAQLQYELGKLRGSRGAATLRLAVLRSLRADSPGAVAVSVWNIEKQSGVCLAQNLSPLPADKSYQLWIVDTNYASPIDAGLFRVDAVGGARLDIRVKPILRGINSFYITIEPKVGSAVPARDQLVLSGSAAVW